MKISPLLEGKGLISFEEITDYNLIDEKQLRLKKRKNSESVDPGVEAKKPKFLVKKNVDRKKTNKSKVKFSDEVTVGEFDKSDKQEIKIKKVKKLKNSKSKKAKKNKSHNSNSTSRLNMFKTDEDTENNFDQEDFETKMSAWFELALSKELLRGLYEKGFYQPMPIQKLVIPEAIKNRSNIIGTAQTGSGKTLAFGLPILTQLIDSANTNEFNKDTDSPAPQALILTPTRELAIQIKDHLQVCSKYKDIKIACVVGGISQLKQERLLLKNPEIIVATPGRLMQMIEEGHEYLNNIIRIKYLVIDEADRMIEKGHFSEVEKILGLVNKDDKVKTKRQNFLFSATLITKYDGDFDENKPKKEKTEAQIKREKRAKLNSLVEKIQMTKQPKFFDLTTQQVTAENLLESKIFCQLKEKDIYLYYFTCKYQGRTLVFANSIDCVRRLTNLFRLLKKTPLHLHANMDQKQRLKNLEKFNAQENSFLIASDVAARGLDIPGVKHVIHYQCPRSAEIYVHRSGRTARSTSEGLSVLLISPDEINLYRKIVKTFKKDKEIKDYPIDLDYYKSCESRVNLAKKIDELQHQLNREKNDSNWYTKNAKLMDIEIDDEILKETHVDDELVSKNRRKLSQYKQDLDRLLKQMIYPKFMSKKYLEPKNVEEILAINKSETTALNDFKNKINNKKKVKKEKI
ncbi:unnamed protein product [Brachionus calyciflorus]|uniref:ATP-dependent RNA helicase n=1 Tax=Brachionus calyciflorus TaxID=104777 RepID=A0A814J3F9_9BILA|nr:unnamed protein product [Brachionus calyciflorus]